MIKDYEILNPSVREVICYVFEIVQQALKNILTSSKDKECATVKFDKLK